MQDGWHSSLPGPRALTGLGLAIPGSHVTGVKVPVSMTGSQPVYYRCMLPERIRRGHSPINTGHAGAERGMRVTRSPEK